jgi:hypothetical protein
MPRPLRPAFAALSLVAAALVGPLASGTFQPAAAQTSGTATSVQPALSVDQARAAARRVLDAVKSGNANARYAQFSDELKAISSPSMVAATIRTQPKILSYELLSVRSGVSSSTVEAEITTSAGKAVMFIVLNPQGKISRYYVDRTDDPASEVALNFVKALSSGNFITAESFLSPDFQKDIPPAALQSKWLGLQRETGTFVRVGRAVEAESTPEARLVLVNVEFNRLTDNLYVILNANNQIVGVDFPETPAKPQPVR